MYYVIYVAIEFLRNTLGNIPIIYAFLTESENFAASKKFVAVVLDLGTTGLAVQHFTTMPFSHMIV